MSAEPNRVIPLPTAVRASGAASRRGGRFRSILERASDVVAVVAADTTLTYVTPSVEQALGYAPEELLGRRLADLVHVADRQRAFDATATAATGVP
ncbi:MAG: PAS domain-containing protein, partial [Chloroflexota bacterium]|nr:PAS domain-containing protein [Chloroflexota bacterium]